MLNKVKEVVEKDVRPYIKNHGGDIKVLDVHEGTVSIKLSGSCSGCPAARITTEGIVKAAIIEKIPEIKDVVLDNAASQEMLDFARKMLNKKK